MIHFKNHKPGFSFIELMIAITLLSIFGTTLFMIQATVFSKTSRAHNKVVTMLELNKLRSSFELEKFNLQQQKQSINSMSINKELANPPLNIKLRIKQLPENSALFKDFSKNIRLIDQEVTIDTIKDHLIIFVFTPPIQETKEAS